MGLFLTLSLTALLAGGCSGGDPEQLKRELAASMSNKGSGSAEAYYDRSIELGRMNGCWNCHHVDNDLIGPSWRRVSERYKDDPQAQALLIDKVKHGGSGGVEFHQRRRDAAQRAQGLGSGIGELVGFILSLAKGDKPPAPQTP